MTIEQDANAQDKQPEAGQETGGEFSGNSILTKPDAEPGKEDASQPGAGKDSQNKEPDAEPGKEDPAEKVPDKPEGYAFKFAEGTQVDQELLTGFQKAAHELGISQGKAQKLAEMYEAHAAKAGERVRTEQQKAIESAKTQWEAEIEKSPTFTQDREYARSALRQYGDTELYALLDQTNLGSHPKMWAFLAKIGKTLAEPGFKGETAGRAEKTAAEIMYPNQGK